MPRRATCPGRSTAFLLAYSIVLGVGPVAHAATIQVDTVDDDVQQGAIGTCSLREALIAANRNIAVDGCRSGAPGADVVRVPAGTYVLTAASGSPEDEALRGDLDVTEAVTIEGTGPAETIVDAESIDRVVEVLADVTATLRDLSLTGGLAPLASSGGGGVLNHGTLALERVHVRGNRSDRGLGGGISNLGTLTLEQSEVRENFAKAMSYTESQGGGIYASGPLTLTRSLVADNRVQGFNSTSGANFAHSGYGGGIYASHDLAIVDSEVLRNEAQGGATFVEAVGAGFGGGLYTTGHSTITGSTIAENAALAGTERLTYLARGGGILNVGRMAISYSTIRDNVAKGLGAPNINTIRGGGIHSAVELVVTNSTISGNAALGTPGFLTSRGGGAEGGGLYTVGTATRTTLVNVSFADNFVEGGRGGPGLPPQQPAGTGGFARGGALHRASGALTLVNTLFARNAAVGGAGGFGNGGPDGPPGPSEGSGCHGTSAGVSLGGNVEQPGDTCTLDDPSDQVALSAAEVVLAPLADNGGPTATHALGAGSLAIDAGVVEHCPVDDQRRYGRTDGACDTGAFEAGATPLCTDADGDGYAIEGASCGPVDCDDANPDVNPGAAEIPGNGVDDDCDPTTPVSGCSTLADTGAGGATPSWRGIALALGLAAIAPALRPPSRRRGDA